ncbi:hypothetical protein HDU79_010662 [Rhizoclosmatium sp. JEL0117]|nr:hypothetical protein HDU79_010662 [Rhizoclosmatium sp. JEL0117]
MRTTDPVLRPLLVCMDETPRAAQTLRFAIDNLLHTQTEPLSLLFSLPPQTSTILKQKVTSRIKSFIQLCIEPYAPYPPTLNLYILDRPDLVTAIQDLCVQIHPRMVVLGEAGNVLRKGDVGDKLAMGTGAVGTQYYATEYTNSERGDSPTPGGGHHLVEKSSKGSLGAAEKQSIESHHHEGLLGAVEDLWHRIEDWGMHHGRKGSVSQDDKVVEAKSAYAVEGAFVDMLKEHVPVPVVVVQVLVQE